MKGASLDLQSHDRILVIQLARLGDVIQTTPLLRELVEATPGQVEVLVLEETSDAVQELSGLGATRTVQSKWMALNEAITEGFREHRVPPEAPGLLQTLALPDYSRVINISYHALDCWLAGRIPCRSREGGAITEQGEWLYFGDAQSYLPALVSCREQNWFNLVDIFRCAGPRKRIPDPSSRPYVHASREFPFALPPGRKVAVNPGASRSDRCWPAASFARLAEGFERLGFVPVLVGAPSDQAVCAEVKAACHATLPNFCGKTSVPQMARLLSQVELLVSGDTGAVHIAAAVGTPVVGLYGASAYFRETAPWGQGHLILQAPLHAEVALLDPDMVLAAALNRLGAVTEVELRRVLDTKSVAGWETEFLSAGADPLGGLTYRPLHSNRLGLEELFTRALRHVLARDFCGSRSRISLDYLGGRIGLASTSALRVDAAQVRLEIASLMRALDGMSRAAAQCRRLAMNPTRQSSAESSKLVGLMIGALEEMKGVTRDKPMLKPMIQYLDWKLRMSPPLAPRATFEYHEQEYRRTAGFLSDALSLTDALLSGGEAADPSPASRATGS